MKPLMEPKKLFSTQDQGGGGCHLLSLVSHGCTTPLLAPDSFCSGLQVMLPRGQLMQEAPRGGPSFLALALCLLLEWCLGPVVHPGFLTLVSWDSTSQLARLLGFMQRAPHLLSSHSPCLSQTTALASPNVSLLPSPTLSWSGLSMMFFLSGDLHI